MDNIKSIRPKLQFSKYNSYVRPHIMISFRSKRIVNIFDLDYKIAYRHLTISSFHDGTIPQIDHDDHIKLSGQPHIISLVSSAAATVRFLSNADGHICGFSFFV